MKKIYKYIDNEVDIINKTLIQNEYLYEMTYSLIYTEYKLNAYTIILEIKNNKLIIHKNLTETAGAFVRRGESLFKLINLTLKNSTKGIKDGLFYIYVGDEYLYKYKNLPIFTFSKPINKQGLLFPDHTFVDIEPENKTDKDKAKPITIETLYEEENKNKINEIFFIGQNISLYQDKKFNIRKYFSGFKKPFNVIIDGKFMPMKDFSKYKYLLNLPGAWPWSFRFKFLFLMKSLVINVELHDISYKSDERWINIFDLLFEPDIDYINIKFYYDPKNKNKNNEIKNIDILKKKILNIYNNCEKNKIKYNNIIKNGYKKSKLLKLENVYNVIEYSLNKLDKPIDFFKNNEKKYNKIKKYIKNNIDFGMFSKVYDYKNNYIIKLVINKINHNVGFKELNIYSIISKSKYKNYFLELKDAFVYEDKTIFIIEKCDVCLNDMKYEDIDWDKLYVDIKEGMEILHSMNIIHKDIQPKNIMYSYSKNKFYLIDFGLSYNLSKLDDVKLNYDYEMFADIPNKYKVKFLKKELSLKELQNKFTKKEIEYYIEHTHLLDNKTDKNNYIYSRLGNIYIQKNKIYDNDYENKLFKKYK